MLQSLKQNKEEF